MFRTPFAAALLGLSLSSIGCEKRVDQDCSALCTDVFEDCRAECGDDEECTLTCEDDNEICIGSCDADSDRQQ